MRGGWPATWLFSNSSVSSFTSNNQSTVSAVRRDLRFFVLKREDLFADAMHFLLSYLKTLGLVWPGFELATFRLADPRSPN